MDTGKKPWYRRIPGFRSGTWWKMVVASLFYLALLNGIMKAATTTPEQRAEQERLAAEKKAADELAAAEAAAKKEAEILAEVDRLIESADESIEYKQVVKNVDEYKGKVVVWTGKVLNITEGKKETTFQVSLEGALDSFVATCEGKIPDVFKEDEVTVTGEVKGTVSGKNAFGATITAVKLRALKIVKIE